MGRRPGAGTPLARAACDDDAPDVATDQNADGRIDRRVLEAIGIASHVETVTFQINGNSA